MQIKKIFLTGILCALLFHTYALPQKGGTIHGKVVHSINGALSGVTVRLLPLQRTAVTDDQGRFSFSALPAGEYTVVVQALSYLKSQRTLSLAIDQQLAINFSLDEEGGREMQEVSVLGLSKSQQVNKQPYAVVSIDAKALSNTTMDIGQVLNRVSGARVRESGGVGSDFRFSLNGFSGKQIKFFLDGVPMDNFGSSFQLNNIPVNFADRIEVYKGVVPVWLGGDALGGAVNIVTNSNPGTYIDASYSFGSFNTHKSAVNAGYTAPSGFTVQLNAFQNYSDNDYWVNVDVVDHETGLNNPARVRRFHDRYHNETVVLKAGFRGKKFADLLLLGGTFGKNRADIQTGNRMYDVYGSRWRSGNLLQPAIQYTKRNLFTKGLDLRLNGNFNFGEERSVDTAYKRYTWDGTFVFKDPANPDRPGGESSYTDYKFRNNNGVANAALNYQLNEKHSFSLNELFSTFNRKGKNRLDPDNIFDRQPKITRKHITGLGYRAEFSEKFNATAFIKHYYQQNVSYDATSEFNRETGQMEHEIHIRKGNFSKSGYGFAGTYFLWPELQLKGSYERAYRLPENTELFGDMVNERGNSNLRPESSQNINLGATYQQAFNQDHFVSLQASFVYRNAKDYIRSLLIPGGTNGEYIQMSTNESNVKNRGVDAELRYAYRDRFSINTSFTYQNLRNDTEFETLPSGERSKIPSVVYGDRIPNTPYLFGNASSSLYFNNVFQKGNRLSITYNLMYVNRFYLFWPSQGSKNTKLDIPVQWAHDASMVYTVKGGKYNVAVECLNLTDAILYDNFKLQKPSRSFNLKLRYYFSTTAKPAQS